MLQSFVAKTIALQYFRGNLGCKTGSFFDTFHRLLRKVFRCPTTHSVCTPSIDVQPSAGELLGKAEGKLGNPKSASSAAKAWEICTCKYVII